MRRSAGRSFCLTVVLLVWATGCGRTSTSSGISPEPSLAPASSSPPTTGSPGQWQEFTSAQLGYTIQLPPFMAYQGSTTGSYPSDYFSNENVGAPQLMDQNGVFFTIVMTADSGDQCLKHNLGGAAIDRDHAITLDGTPASLKVFLFPGTAEPFMVLNTQHAGRCYQF